MRDRDAPATHNLSAGSARRRGFERITGTRSGAGWSALETRPACDGPGLRNESSYCFLAGWAARAPSFFFAASISSVIFVASSFTELAFSRACL